MKKEATKTDKFIEEVKKTLPKKSNEINIFKVLQCHGHEIRHSNILAWLMDPKESHGLNDTFLQDFVSKHCSKTFGDLDSENVEIFRENPSRGGSKYRYDILIIDKKRLFTVFACAFVLFFLFCTFAALKISFVFSPLPKYAGMVNPTRIP